MTLPSSRESYKDCATSTSDFLFPLSPFQHSQLANRISQHPTSLFRLSHFPFSSTSSDKPSHPFFSSTSFTFSASSDSSTHFRMIRPNLSRTALSHSPFFHHRLSQHLHPLLPTPPPFSLSPSHPAFVQKSTFGSPPKPFRRGNPSSWRRRESMDFPPHTDGFARPVDARKLIINSYTFLIQ